MKKKYGQKLFVLIASRFKCTLYFNIYDEFVGEESGARHKALPSSIMDKYNMPDPFVDNGDFQIQADDILDFSEINPFGRP